MRGQRQAVLNELKAGNEVTSMSMWRKYGITRLSGIIYELTAQLVLVKRQSVQSTFL